VHTRHSWRLDIFVRIRHCSNTLRTALTDCDVERILAAIDPSRAADTN